ncbi:hypothetical protein DYB37_003546, partial [Aphanomyces astaci]
VQEDGVNGVVWNDAQGLLLGAHGDFEDARFGLGALNTLVARANALNTSDEKDVAPVVRIETTKRIVVVQQQKDSTVLAVSTSKPISSTE